MNQEFELKSQAVQEQMLPIQQLEPNPWNRKNFEAQGLQELSESIKLKGILEPLVVKRLDDSKYRIASGERRWRAAQLAGLTEVPCRILELSDTGIRDMNLIANIQREDIPALEKAAMVKAIMDAEQLTQAQIAARLGKSVEWVSGLLSILTLPQEVQQKLSGYALGAKPMQAIASLPNADYKSQIVKELQNGTIKSEQVERRVHQLHNGFKASMAKRKLKAEKDNASEKATTTEPVKTVGAETAAASPLKVGKSDCAVPAVAAPAIFPSVATALKDDVADALFPSFGRVGGVMRSTLDTAWGAPKKHLFKWGLVFALVSFMWHPVLKTINYVFTRLMRVEVNQAINKNTIPSVAVVAKALETPKLTPAMLTSISAPTGLKGELVSGHAVRVSWQPVPGCVGYNFYSAIENLEFRMENHKLVKSTKVLWTPGSGAAIYRLTVTAVDADDHESVFSEALTLDMR